eukprot:m.238199 g.238199  ORF g.238199 m.238199 type:complete len:133 (+) comp15287_c0_seq3:1199-1597(+)
MLEYYGPGLYTASVLLNLTHAASCGMKCLCPRVQLVTALMEYKAVQTKKEKAEEARRCAREEQERQAQAKAALLQQRTLQRAVIYAINREMAAKESEQFQLFLQAMQQMSHNAFDDVHEVDGTATSDSEDEA